MVHYQPIPVVPTTPMPSPNIIKRLLISVFERLGIVDMPTTRFSPGDIVYIDDKGFYSPVCASSSGNAVYQVGCWDGKQMRYQDNFIGII